MAETNTCGWAAKGSTRVLSSLGGRPHDRHVELVVLQQLEQLVAVARGQADVHTAVLFFELRQQLHHEIFGGADHADGQDAGLGMDQSGCGVFGIFQSGQDATGVHQHVLTRRGEADFSALSLKQRHAHMAFQLFDLHGDRWRGEMQILRCAHKAQVFGHFIEHPQLTEGCVFHSGLA